MVDITLGSRAKLFGDLHKYDRRNDGAWGFKAWKSIRLSPRRIEVVHGFSRAYAEPKGLELG